MIQRIKRAWTIGLVLLIAVPLMVMYDDRVIGGLTFVAIVGIAVAEFGLSTVATYGIVAIAAVAAFALVLSGVAVLAGGMLMGVARLGGWEVPEQI